MDDKEHIEWLLQIIAAPMSLITEDRWHEPNPPLPCLVIRRDGGITYIPLIGPNQDVEPSALAVSCGNQVGWHAGGHFLRFREGLDDQIEVHQDMVRRGWEPVYRQET